MARMINILIIRTDGTEEIFKIQEKDFRKKLEVELKATSFATVDLRDGRFMYIDDLGWVTKTVKKAEGQYTLEPVRARKPINEKATKIYHSICVPGTTHQIAGDVAIIKENDFGDEY